LVRGQPQLLEQLRALALFAFERGAALGQIGLRYAAAFVGLFPGATAGFEGGQRALKGCAVGARLDAVRGEPGGQGIGTFVTLGFEGRAAA
jgi:hypothetical protein